MPDDRVAVLVGGVEGGFRIGPRPKMAILTGRMSGGAQNWTASKNDFIDWQNEWERSTSVPRGI